MKFIHRETGLIVNITKHEETQTYKFPGTKEYKDVAISTEYITDGRQIACPLTGDDTHELMQAKIFTEFNTEIIVLRMDI